jgi:hypothetical protein
MSFIAASALAAAIQASPQNWLGFSTGKQQAGQKVVESTIPNTLSKSEKEAGWKLLFDGKTTKGWRSYRGESMPKAWRVSNGLLRKFPESGGGDIVTVDQFDNFVLKFEWRIAKGGNSGLMYRVSEDQAATWHSGAEYQLLDDPAYGVGPMNKTGAYYDMYPNAVPESVKPAETWNSTKLVADGAKIEHWLNGHKTVSTVVGSEDWLTRYKKSKFVKWPNFGQNKKGHIAFQDHGAWIEFKNIKIKEL